MFIKALGVLKCTVSVFDVSFKLLNDVVVSIDVDYHILKSAVVLLLRSLHLLILSSYEVLGVFLIVLQVIIIIVVVLIT